MTKTKRLLKATFAWNSIGLCQTLFGSATQQTINQILEIVIPRTLF